MTTDPKIARLMTMTEKLTAALENDIAALERGAPRDLRLPEPEIEQLSLLYGREAKDVDRAMLDALPKDIREALTAMTKRFHEALARHDVVLTRVRNASEGMIRAIAEEVVRLQDAVRPYGAKPAPTPRKPSAMVYNSVI